MSVIHRSNVAATGDVLGSALLFSKSAADLYAEYEARVLAGGGTVFDPASAQAAIQSAIDGEYYLGTNMAVSTRWGRALSGGNLTKLFSLVGGAAQDVTFVGTVQNDTTTYAWPSAYFTTANSYGLSGNMPLAIGNAHALSVVAAPIGTNPFVSSAENTTTSNYPFNVSVRGIGGVSTASARDTAGNIMASVGYAAASLHEAHGIFIDRAANAFTHVVNGQQKSVQTLSNPPIDARALNKRYMLNGVIAGATEISADLHRMTEAWALHTSTLTQAQALSLHQRARHA